MDLIFDFATGGRPGTRDYITPIRVPNQRGQLDFIAAGAVNDDYVRTLQELEWATLYTSRGLGNYLELCRAEWKIDYDFILIDSRTGITDIGGICTVQLPYLLVMLFTANEQSVAGMLDVACRASRAHDSLPYDRAGLMILPVLGRFDAREEYKRAVSWQQRLASDLKPIIDTWAPPEVSVNRILNHLTIPYVAYWSFGEELRPHRPLQPNQLSTNEFRDPTRRKRTAAAQHPAASGARSRPHQHQPPVSPHSDPAQHHPPAATAPTPAPTPTTATLSTRPQ